jgi:Fe-S-cluster containining protein
VSAPNGCSGACCAAFHYAYTHDEVAAITAEAHPQDLFIQNMLIPLSTGEARERREGFGYGIDGIDLTQDNHQWFTCRHWNEETRLCGAYEDRPSMCRDFPYREPCATCGFCPDEDIVTHYVERDFQRQIEAELA